MKNIIESTYHLALIFLICLLISGQVSASTFKDSTQAKEQSIFPIIKPSGFIQQHFTIDNIGENPMKFSIYRARLGFTGQFSEKIKLNLRIGALESPERKPALVDVFADFNIHPLFNLRAGQFLVPFGVEGSGPISLNPAIERSYPSRKMNKYRMFRDVGLMASGKYSFISYSFAVLNGGGANVPENANPKDIVFRTIFTLFPGFDAGLSVQLGNYQHESLGSLNRQKWAVHIEYDKESLLFRGELMGLQQEINAVGDNKSSVGGYFLGRYSFSEKFNLISRIAYYQPDDSGGNDYTGFTLGSNYFITSRTRLSVNGIISSDAGGNKDKNVVLNVQLQFRL